MPSPDRPNDNYSEENRSETNTEINTENSDRQPSPLIVGIGASAGGLAVISEILENLPADTGMAFVLVQHLSPDQHSMLSELLGNTTEMPVTNAEDGMGLEANHVYVIPPNTRMTIDQGQLQLAECDQTRGRVKTIDVFFKSLAEDQKNRAIAIVLSGSNDDGAAGVEAVRAQGGITMAQRQDTAEFSEMPQAAIATGCVDFVLSPSAIARELVTISRQPYVQTPPPTEEPEPVPPIEEDRLLQVFNLLERNTGINFSDYKPTTFGRRLRRRMALHKMSSLEDYIQYLRDDPSEIRALYQDVLISVTSFFRDGEVYIAIKERVLPALISEENPPSSIRVWVPGCATGEEVYSIAICLLEYLDSLSINPTIQIFGTDINDQAIDEARLGIYRESRMEQVSAERRRRFFVEVDGGYQIARSVRERCVFARQDLGSDPPFSDIDIISCRNVLIYFKAPLQQRILSIFHYSLKPDGFLILGNSESVGNTSDLFSVVDNRVRIYKRNNIPTRINFDFVTSHIPQTPSAQRQSFSPSWERSNFQQWADQIVINRYAPAGVIVNDRLDILQFRGDTSPFLRPAPGEPSFNLLKMLRPGLLVDVQAAIDQAREANIAVQRRRENVEEGQTSVLCIEVIPFSASVSHERYFLILFEQIPESDASEDGIALSERPDVDISPSEARAEIRRLRQELASTRQELLDTQTFLQINIEEQEATNQQLITANEEILSSNEELKSTNEELQTAKEEIQSSNEELKTTNEELQSRNREAKRAHDDLNNLIDNVNIPILMLSDDLRIRRFTPVARGIFNLIPSDVGRPMTDMRFRINVPNLEAMVIEVIDTLNSRELEVQDSSGHWYLLRIRPYRTIDNRIDGAVLALVDIDNLKRTLDRLAASRSYAENIVEMIPVPVMVLSEDFQVHRINQSFLETFQVSQDAMIGRSLLECCEGEWNIPELRSPLEQVVSNPELNAAPLNPADRNQTSLVNIEFEHTFTGLGRKTLVANARVIAGEDHSCVILLAIKDITARKQAEGDRLQLIQAETARAEAEAANASKDAFLSMLSHELRTPLTSILAWLDQMQRNQVAEADRDRVINDIHASVLTQLRLIEDLLDISRIAQGRLSITPQNIDLVEVVQQSINTIQPQAIAKDISITTDFRSPAEHLWVDPVRMQQVFVNLLVNAIKFTPTGGDITVTLTASTTQVQVQVSDTGQGIPPDKLPTIFERFQQADTSDTRRQGGMGLGLYIVRYIVEAHDGQIQADSPGEGQGSTFTVTLPRTEPAPTAAPEPVEPRKAPAPPASPASPEQPPLSFLDISLEGVQILLVDDEPANLAVFKHVFGNRSATVITAQSASEALDALRDNAIDVMISDIGLPDVNGYELMQQVRSLPPEQGGEVRAIALTAYATPQHARASQEAGFQIHLAKPVDIEVLTRAVYGLVRE